MKKPSCLQCQNFSVNGDLVTNMTDDRGNKHLITTANKLCLAKNINLNNLNPVYCNSFKKS